MLVEPWSTMMTIKRSYFDVTRIDATSQSAHQQRGGGSATHGRANKTIHAAHASLLLTLEEGRHPSLGA